MTLQDALRRSNSSPEGGIVQTVEAQLKRGEHIVYAAAANAVLDAGPRDLGIVVVTTHRILYCSPDTALQMPFAACIGVGDIIGGPSMDLTCEGTRLNVGGSKAQLLELQTKLLTAIEQAPTKPPLDLPTGLFLQ